MYQLTIKAPDSLLSVILRRDVTPAQSILIDTLLGCTDGLELADIERLEGALNLTLMNLGNGASPWASSGENSVNGYDSPFGAGDSVEADRG